MSKKWKKYALKVKDLTSYNIVKDPEQSKKRRKKAKKFYNKWDFRFEDTWNLDYVLSLYMLPRIAYLRDNHCGYPGELATYDENGKLIENGNDKWIEILDKIILALDHIVDEYIDDSKLPYWINDSIDKEKMKQWNEEVDEGLELLGKYFRGLWD